MNRAKVQTVVSGFSRSGMISTFSLINGDSSTNAFRMDSSFGIVVQDYQLQFPLNKNIYFHEFQDVNDARLCFVHTDVSAISGSFARAPLNKPCLQFPRQEWQQTISQFITDEKRMDRAEFQIPDECANRHIELSGVYKAGENKGTRHPQIYPILTTAVFFECIYKPNPKKMTMDIDRNSGNSLRRANLISHFASNDKKREFYYTCNNAFSPGFIAREY
ncbi:hypothetical protein CSKR_114075 [Clonorchis sinensis]|uniref:Uncharacterized protein n=1 Tax=Clonorchis sinensis TaxID=79923 RepID=A0A419PWD0_CLOSI|nr:hypothetical protein CSKR_114075 [Clonorchis sinensis]